MSEPTMSQFATELDCLRARVKYFHQRTEAAEAKLRELEMQEPRCKLSESAPGVIYLQISDDESDFHEEFPRNLEGVTWCADSVLSCEVKYIRADLAYPKPFPAPKQEEK